MKTERSIRGSGAYCGEGQHINPRVFAPVRYRNRLLVDGWLGTAAGRVARDLGADIVIGVDVTFAEDRQTHIRNTLDVILQAIEILERQIFTQITRHQAT